MRGTSCLSLLCFITCYNGKTASQANLINHMCWGLNSHWFLVVGDGHQPNSRVYIPILRIPVIQGGMSLSPIEGVEKDPGTYGSNSLDGPSLKSEFWTPYHDYWNSVWSGHPWLGTNSVHLSTYLQFVTMGYPKFESLLATGRVWVHILTDSVHDLTGIDIRLGSLEKWAAVFPLYTKMRWKRCIHIYTYTQFLYTYIYVYIHGNLRYPPPKATHPPQ